MQQMWQQLIRFGFRLLYQEMAWSYDAVSWVVSLGQWRRWQEAALAYLPPPATAPRVLEIGHGPGHMLAALADRGYQPLGLDLSEQMGRMARQRTNGRIPLLRARVGAIPLANGSVEAVLSTFPTDYIVAPQTITEIKRVLAENGRFVILPQAHLTGHSPIHRLIELAFRLTGQRPVAGKRYSVSGEQDSVSSKKLKVESEMCGGGLLVDALTTSGFVVRQHVVKLSGSVALVIVAECNSGLGNERIKNPLIS
ncbi:MAG: class I SAM-dependent methyltransferase [Chloroflexota bacterium]